MIERFELYFPELAKHAENYRVDPYHQYELIIDMDNGMRFLYDDLQNTIRKLPRDVDYMTKEETIREFGRRLDRLMYQKHITQAELSELSGIEQPTISAYINGQRNPGLYALDKIAKALGCSLDEFRCL